MKKISKKNYVTYGIIVVMSIAFLLYLNSWYKAYKSEELKNSYISKYVNELSYEEFNNYIKENPNFIAYIGKKNCSECVALEKDMYKTIKNNDLLNEFIFLNIEDNIEDFNKVYKTDIKVVPSAIIVRNREIVNYIKVPENTLVRNDLFVQMLEEIEIIK